MTTPTPAQKVRVLEGSLRCFALGLCSLIPLVGAGCAIAALRSYGRVCRASAHDWNPARPYLCWGRALAWLGALLTLAILLVALLSVQDALGL